MALTVVAALQATGLPPWFQTVTAVASAIVSIMLAIILLATVPLAFEVRRRMMKGTSEINKALSEAGPLIRDANALVTDLREIARSVRADVEQVHRGVVKAGERLAELDAMAGVLRSGVEDAVVSVAAVAKGVRAGAEALGLGADAELIDVGATRNGDDRTGRSEGRARPRIRAQRNGE
jgi:methyl-accepting chemotaxis protein